MAFFIFEFSFNIISFNLAPGMPYNVLDSVYTLELIILRLTPERPIELALEARCSEGSDTIDVSKKLLFSPY